MKRMLFGYLLVLTMMACQPTLPTRVLEGTFVGPGSVQASQGGLTSYAEIEITLKPLTATTVEVSSPEFKSFIIQRLAHSGTTIFLSDNEQNLFHFSGEPSTRSLLVDWTTEIAGQRQTIRFGGRKKSLVFVI
ncbi:hypothetical protein [Siphonobacter sp. BAB-5385]|uniref:hypothetical protein n=1 Tax=Siphonobacter sp. BAB-5385 TaxID=1864822 RepID=UPI00113FD1FB|nr:hypothetical protein [Siphonobacter sp. BAB-5385]